MDCHYLRQTPARTFARSERRQMFSTYPIVKELYSFVPMPFALLLTAPEPYEYTSFFRVVKGSQTDFLKSLEKLFNPPLRTTLPPPNRPLSGPFNGQTSQKTTLSA